MIRKLPVFPYSAAALALSLFAMPGNARAQAPETAPPPTCDDSDSSCLVIEQNESSNLQEFGRLDFLSIVEDSRCPVDAFCFWGGQVQVELKREFGGKADKFTVGIGGNLADRWTDELSGRTLVLEQVWPERSLQDPIDKPYQLKLRIEASNSDSSDSPDQTQSPDAAAEVDQSL